MGKKVLLALFGGFAVGVGICVAERLFDCLSAEKLPDDDEDDGWEDYDEEDYWDEDLGEDFDEDEESDEYEEAEEESECENDDEELNELHKDVDTEPCLCKSFYQMQDKNKEKD